MSERFSFSEAVPANPDRLLLNEARYAASEMLRGPEDQLTREIAEKILIKADIKDRVDDLTSHADDVTVYQEYKKLGLFIVRDAEATFDYQDTETGFDLKRGDAYLDLHLPPVPQGLRSREAVEASLDLVQKYIDVQQLQPKYLMGVTYQRMAQLAQRRFGFTVTYPRADALPEGVVRGVEQVYRGFTQAGMNGADIGLPAIVFREVGISTESADNRSKRAGFLLGRLASSQTTLR